MPFIHIIMHLQAVDAFWTVFIFRLVSFVGSLRNFPKDTIIFSSTLSLSNWKSLFNNEESPSNFKEAAHQSVSIFKVSLFFFFS